jgi:polyisoprenyl-teichoic acid--peptidoglycan teichoic acid transferase
MNLTRPEQPTRTEQPAPTAQSAAPAPRGRRRTYALSALGACLLLALAASFLLGAWTGTPAASPTPSASPSPSPTPTSEPTATPQPTPTPNPFDQAMLNHRYTVLIIGEDSDRRREARNKTTRTDTMMVVSVSPKQRHIAMISVPRDMVDIPLANGLTYTSKVNGIAWEYGYEGLRGAMEKLLSVDIDAYIKVDMDNFVQLVDAVGGVRVKNTEYLYDGHLHLALGPGTYRLDGATALKYVRSRYTSSDYARAARQQQLLLAMVRKFLNPNIEWDLDGVLPMLDSLKTDVDLADLKTLMEMGRRAREANVVTMVLAPPRFSIGYGDQQDGRGWVILPNLGEIRAYANAVMGD